MPLEGDWQLPRLARSVTLPVLIRLRREGFEVLISLLKGDEQLPRYDRTRRGFGL
jgi:hypothetical protein